MCVYTYLYISVYITWCCSYNFKRDLKCPIYSITPEPWLVHHFSRGSTIEPSVSLNELKRELKETRGSTDTVDIDPSSRDSSRMQAPFYKDT